MVFFDGSHQLPKEGTPGPPGPPGPPGIGYALTDSGDYDIQNKKLLNVDTDEAHRLSAVNMITLNNKVGSSHEKNNDIDLQDKYSVINSKQQSFADLSLNNDNLVSYNDVKSIFLSRKETFPMETALDMGNRTIFNVKDPTVADQGVNKKYVDAETVKTMIEINKVRFDSNKNDSIIRSYINTKADQTYAGGYAGAWCFENRWFR